MRDLLLLLSDSQFHSGEELGEALGITRAAIWKKLKKLESIGFSVHSVKGRGYRLPQSIELISEEALLQAGLPNNIHTTVCFETDSTNAELKRALSCSMAMPQLVIAERQMTGKGRRGREWQGGVARNVMLSFGWRFEAGTGAIEGLSLGVGVAVSRTLKQFGIQNIGLKWPNDVQVNNQKICGILLEMVADADCCDVIIGIGLNVSMVAQDMENVDQPWTDMASLLGKTPSRNAIVATLVQELVLLCEHFDQMKGLQAYAQEWRQHDVLDGHLVRVITGSNEQTGYARGIDPKGALIFDDGENIRHLYGGEVSIRKQ